LTDIAALTELIWVIFAGEVVIAPD